MDAFMTHILKSKEGQMKRLHSIFLAVLCLALLAGCEQVVFDHEDEQYTYSSTTIRSDTTSITPIQVLLWTETLNENSEVVQSGDGLGAEGFFRDASFRVSDIPRIVAVSEIFVDVSPQSTEIGSPQIFDTNCEELPITPSWQQLHMMPQGEYIVVFTEYTDSKRTGSDEDYSWVSCHENIFRLMIGADGEVDSAIHSQYVTKDEDKFIIRLPILGKEIKVRDEYVRYLPLIDDALLEVADKTINEKTSQYKEEPAYYLQVDSLGYLCLATEQIVDIDPPKTQFGDGEVIGGGCGIDHDHVFFSERISK